MTRSNCSDYSHWCFPRVDVTRCNTHIDHRNGRCWIDRPLLQFVQDLKWNTRRFVLYLGGNPVFIRIQAFRRQMSFQSANCCKSASNYTVISSLRSSDFQFNTFVRINQPKWSVSMIELEINTNTSLTAQANINRGSVAISRLIHAFFAVKTTTLTWQVLDLWRTPNKAYACQQRRNNAPIQQSDSCSNVSKSLGFRLAPNAISKSYLLRVDSRPLPRNVWGSIESQFRLFFSKSVSFMPGQSCNRTFLFWASIRQTSFLIFEFRLLFMTEVH